MSEAGATLNIATTLREMAARRPGARAVVVPHAGYIYSGGVAGKTFSSVAVPDQVVILGPNHHGRGHVAAVRPGGYGRGSALRLSYALCSSCRSRWKSP